MPNPQFSIDFHIEGDNVPRQSLLIFEIRSASKELLASRRITLHELLGTFKSNLFYVLAFLKVEIEISIVLYQYKNRIIILKIDFLEVLDKKVSYNVFYLFFTYITSFPIILI